MNPNRRMMLMLAALAVILVALVSPFWSELTENYARARNQARQAEYRLQQAYDLRDQVTIARAERQSLERLVSARPKNFDLYSHVNDKLKRQAAARYARLTSSGNTSSGRAMQSVNVQFKDAPINKVLDVIHATCAGSNLVVLDRVSHLRPARSGYGVDCEITIISPRS